MSEHKPFLYRSRLYILSAAVGALATCLLLIPSALAVYALSLSAEAAAPLSLLSFGGGCAVSGFIAGSVRRRRGLTVGVRAALPLLLLCAVAALIGGNADGQAMAVKALVAVLTGAAGGVVGVNFKG